MKSWIRLLSLVAAVTLGCGANAKMVPVVIDPAASPRIAFGATRLAQALNEAGLKAAVTNAGAKTGSKKIVVGTLHQACVKALVTSGQLTVQPGEAGKEGFILATCANGTTVVVGGDDSGALYGCLELAKRVHQGHGLPAKVRFADAPKWVLRGPCIGMQKTFILPGRHVYEYPYTPELFPFFYDKKFWNEYLDFLAENRMNVLYLWNGHPFASLVRVPEYPYAVEVSDDVFKQNVEMFHYITQEADKRGIWLVQMFYSIIVSKPFAETNGLETQMSAPVPVVEDYTRKCIAQFVKEYPHVGLMVCMGEALRGLDNQKRWFTNTVAPGIFDGMKAAGIQEPPPLVVRTHAIDQPDEFFPVALKTYTNLYTEAKFNGESLTTWEPRGVRQGVHLKMGELGATHMINVHILANLEPFRYGSQRFIQKCVVAGRDRLGAHGVHLYPLFYWNWPDAPDKTTVPLKQWERDWIWFEAWARYAWNPDIPEDQDRAYWIGRLTEHYGNTNAAAHILDAYNDSGECAPRLLRRFGITEGNRQTLSLGMTLDELVNPKPYKPFTELWESQSPPGERLEEYAAREWKHEPHDGETPPQIVSEVRHYSSNAVCAIEAAAPLVTKNGEEFERLRNDVHCIQVMSENYSRKVEAAMDDLRYKYSHNLADLDRAQTNLAASLESYKLLANLTSNTYWFANSMQTAQRKIPVPGGTRGMGTNYHWIQLVRIYQKEYDDFAAKVAQLHSGAAVSAPDDSHIHPWSPAPFKVLGTNAQTYLVNIGSTVFSDRDYTITSLAPELKGLTGIRVCHEDAKKGHYEPVEFEVSEPVAVLVGYFQSKKAGWLQVPNLETAAQADDRGGIDPVLENAALIDECPAVEIHAFRFGPGRQKLDLIGKGSFVILGVVPQKDVHFERRDAGLKEKK